MQKTRNIRYVEVAVSQTDSELIGVSDTAQVVCVIIRQASGSSTELVTLKNAAGTTVIDLATDEAKDELFEFPSPIKFLGLTVTTSSQCHAWIGITAESNKGIHPDRV